MQIRGTLQPCESVQPTLRLLPAQLPHTPTIPTTGILARRTPARRFLAHHMRAHRIRASSILARPMPAAVMLTSPYLVVRQLADAARAGEDRPACFLDRRARRLALALEYEEHRDGKRNNAAARDRDFLDQGPFHTC